MNIYILSWLSLPALSDVLSQDRTLISSSQLFAALFVGLAIAFALQIVLTGLGVAAGMTALGFLPRQNLALAAGSTEVPSKPRGSLGWLIHVAGFGTLLSVNTVVFAACFLAITLNVLTDPLTAAITGLTIWSVYFLITTWLSLSLVKTFVRSVWQALTTVVREFVTRFTKLFKGQSSAKEKGQIKDIIEAWRVERETTADTLAQTIRSEISSALATSPDRQQFLLPEQLMPSVSSQGSISEFVLARLGSNITQFIERIDRQSLVNTICERADLKEDEAKIVVDELIKIWQQTLVGYLPTLERENEGKTDIGNELLDFLSSADLKSLKHSKLKIDLEDISKHHTQKARIKLSPTQETRIDWFNLINILWQQIDLDKVDLPALLERANSLSSAFKSKSTQSSQESIVIESNASDSALLQLIDYLEHTPKLDLRHIRREINNLVKNSTASPKYIKALSASDVKSITKILRQRSDLTEKRRSQLVKSITKIWREKVSNSHQVLVENNDRAIYERVMTAIARLQQRQDLSDAEIAELADTIEVVRTQLSTEKINSLAKIESILTNVKENIAKQVKALPLPVTTQETITQEFSGLLHKSQAQLVGVGKQIQDFSRATWNAFAVDPEEAIANAQEGIKGTLETGYNRTRQQVQSLQQGAQLQIDRFKHQTQQQADATRKAIAAGIWWYVGTAITSATTAAFAGILAVSSF